MGASGRLRLGLGLAIAALLGGGPADAQVILNAPGFVEKKPEARLPDVRASPLAWPRLDPGSVMCRSEADLDRLAARRLGQEAGPADCRLINTPTAVTIVQRRGAGRTQVRLTDSPNVTGWTDVWLPERAPSVGTRQAGR